MSDTALPEPTALPVHSSDAPPSSAGRSSPGPSGPVDQPPAVIPDEVKERLDKIVYSEVSCYQLQLGFREIEKAMLIQLLSHADRYHHASRSPEAECSLRQSSSTAGMTKLDAKLDALTTYYRISRLS